MEFKPLVVVTPTGEEHKIDTLPPLPISTEDVIKGVDMEPLCDLLESLEPVTHQTRWQLLLKDYYWCKDTDWLQKNMNNAHAMAKSKGLTIIGTIFGNTQICIINNNIEIIPNNVKVL